MQNDLAQLRPPFEHALGAECDGRADGFALCDLLDKLHYAVVVTPRDRFAVQIVERQQVLFVAFDNGRDKVPGGYRVDAQVVAEMISAQDACEAVDSEIGAEHRRRFVLGPLGDGAGPFALLDEIDVAAAHGAAEAGGIDDLVAGEHCLAVDLIRLFPVRIAEVIRR